MKTTKYYFSILILLGFVLSCNVIGGENQPGAGKTDYILKKEFVPMDDGIKLATDVYLPSAGEKFPCILARTPYNKDGFKNDAEWAVKNGFVFVAQDCRGKFESEGQFYPFRNERHDGLAAVKWVRNQNWCNGKIGGWGGSYVGYTQWADSDALDAVTARLTGSDFYQLLYPDGLFSLDLAFKWGFAVSNKTNAFPGGDKLWASYFILPLSQADDKTVKDLDYINDWLEHSSYDKYWKAMGHRGITKCPVLSLGGWYDILLTAQIDDFQALIKKGSHENRLVIGPWCHGGQGFKNEYGGIEKVGNSDDLAKRFLARYIKGEDIKLMQPPFKDKMYNLFIMERNEYYGCDQWPPKATSFTDYYIGPNKYIGLEKPADKGMLEYTYDPANPYPNKGGTALGGNVGPALQNENLSRADQVAFETGVLESPLILLGPISATLYVSSDAPCTDFIVCLQDVFPDANIINIQEGGSPVKLKESGVTKAEISVWATGYQVNPGHKLRAVITSSWFPRFNRNINSCEPIFSATTIKTAHQKIYFGPEHPSSVTLPILKL